VAATVGVGDEEATVATGEPDGEHAVISNAMTAPISLRL
jgi:hypothetical protein